jgi:hypothetical protein
LASRFQRGSLWLGGGGHRRGGKAFKPLLAFFTFLSLKLRFFPAGFSFVSETFVPFMTFKCFVTNVKTLEIYKYTQKGLKMPPRPF